MVQIDEKLIGILCSSFLFIHVRTTGFLRPARAESRTTGQWKEAVCRRHRENIIMSKESKEFISPQALIAPGPAGYSHIAKVNRGAIVYISGQVPSDASGKFIGEGDFEAQVEQIFANLKIAVESAGGTMADVVKLNYYLVADVDQTVVPKMRPIRDRYINVEKPPASTFVVVSRLMRPGWMIEIEAVAAIDA
jgi:enamine deaminase RidA (YjgF/YER057c/UK114 family)